MERTVVQLDAYVVPDDHRVFKISPGRTYRFYRAVRDANAIFLDLRGLEGLDDDPAAWVDKDVLKLIADDRWNREIQSRARGNKPQGAEGVGSTDRRNLTFLKALLLDARKGDFIVVPAEGYTKEVLIGEFTTDAGFFHRIDAADGDLVHTYLGRPVRWWTGIEKRLLSSELIKALHTQTALFVMGMSLYEEVYRLALGNFVYRQRFVSEFHTTKEKFTSEDSAVVSTWFNGFDVLRNAVENGSVETLGGQSFYLLGLSKLPDAQAAELTININSPGEFSVRSSTVFALALMAMLPLASCDSQEIVDNGVTVELKSIGDASTDCAIDVENAVNSYVTALGYERLEQACELAKRAREDATLETNAHLKSRKLGRK